MKVRLKLIMRSDPDSLCMVCQTGHSAESSPRAESGQQSPIISNISACSYRRLMAFAGYLLSHTIFHADSLLSPLLPPITDPHRSRP